LRTHQSTDTKLYDLTNEPATASRINLLVQQQLTFLCRLQIYYILTIWNRKLETESRWNKTHRC